MTRLAKIVMQKANAIRRIYSSRAQKLDADRVSMEGQVSMEEPGYHRVGHWYRKRNLCREPRVCVARRGHTASNGVCVRGQLLVGQSEAGKWLVPEPSNLT